MHKKMGLKTRKIYDNLPFIGINFVSVGSSIFFVGQREVVRLHMEEEQDWRFHSISLACKCQHFSVIMLITKAIKSFITIHHIEQVL